MPLMPSGPYTSTGPVRPTTRWREDEVGISDSVVRVKMGDDLAFLLVDVDGNMVNGWPIISAALTARVILFGSICHHVKREAIRFILSILHADRVKHIAPADYWPNRHLRLLLEQ